MVNFPHKLSSKKSQISISQQKNFANRGMTFEKMISATNEYYLTHGMAVIHIKPTPVQIIRVDYPQRSRAKIVEAYFRQASTTDYSGVYRGHYIDFEAKETRQKNSIPMKNFHLHQIQHMEHVLEHQGICFVLLHFSSQQETYLLPALDLIRFYHQDKGQKSMPLGYIQEYGYIVKQGAFPQIPYLDIIKEHLLGGKTR